MRQLTPPTQTQPSSRLGFCRDQVVLSSTCCVTLSKKQPPRTRKQDSYLTNHSRDVLSLHQHPPPPFFFPQLYTWRWADSSGEIEAILAVGFVLRSVPTGRPWEGTVRDGRFAQLGEFSSGPRSSESRPNPSNKGTGWGKEAEGDLSKADDVRAAWLLEDVLFSSGGSGMYSHYGFRGEPHPKLPDTPILLKA